MLMGIVRVEKNFNCDVDVDVDVLISDRQTSSRSSDDCSVAIKTMVPPTLIFVTIDVLSKIIMFNVISLC